MEVPMYVQPYEGNLSLSSFPPLGNISDGSFPMQEQVPGAVAAGDGVSLSGAPWLNAMSQNPGQTAMFGPLASLMQQLMQMLQSMLGYQGGGCSPSGGEQFFPNANGSSVGDPHLSFNGNHWNSMVSQPNLLNSDSIPGGFAVSTQVTSPNANGITHNQSASIALDNGQTTISMNNAGQASIESYGQTIALAPGQTTQLGNGASVTCNENGSLRCVVQNGCGGEITTSLTPRGQGVDVSVSAQNVDLGGTLVNQPASVAQPVSGSPGPVTLPIVMNPNLPLINPTP